MIVDDNQDRAKSLQELFESNGFQVTSVNNGRNCLFELEKGFQGIIILDIWKPVMECVHTIKKMK
jgi:CheY-like chemotaxis protein